MAIPSSIHPSWANLITGTRQVALQLLPAKILMVRLTMSIKRDGSQENLRACIGEIRKLYESNANSPAAQADIKAIFG